ncbi:MAG: peroxiredoxin [Bdellovibrionales bacterium]|nr:peroxiredoxin [Bdellovibrionales bacterium]
MKKTWISFAAIFSFGFGILAMAEAPKVGTDAPQVVAQDHLGATIDSKKLKGQWVLFYFYPKDDTPGCTKQACAIRDEYAAFKKAKITVLGVSRQNKKSHEEFASKYKIPFSLLLDEEGKIGEAFGISSIPVIGIWKRQSVLVNPEGKISLFIESVDPETHHKVVLDHVKASK